MPTRYRRVGVVLDPELSDALTLATARLSARTQAARLRELALIGARSLHGTEAELDQARRTLDELGATRERGDLLALSSQLRDRRSRVRETPSKSLEWVRGRR